MTRGINNINDSNNERQIMNTATDVSVGMTLDTLSTLTASLDRYLRDVKYSAERALDALAKGNRVDGMGIGYGPIGHQAPFDIATTCAKIEATMHTLILLGATSEQISDAYKVGA